MSSTPLTYGLGTYFRAAEPRRLCAKRLIFRVWTLDTSAPGFVSSAAWELARLYVGLTQAWTHPNAKIADELPTQDSKRKGDFGELVAGALFRQRLGLEIPFQKLELMRPAPNATVQGPDIRALTLSPGKPPEPVLVEAKFRTHISPKEVLGEIKESLERINQEYVIASWRAAVRLMELHPQSHKQFALSAAQFLAQLSATPGTYPEHDKQAVIISERASLTAEKIEEHWGTSPPVSELHVVEVPQAEELIESLHSIARTMTYGDVASAAPHFASGAKHTPGFSAPVISDEAVKALRLSGGAAHLGRLVEASLWFLADWDGMGAARACELERDAADVQVRGLAQLLQGASIKAQRTLRRDELLPFVHTVTSVWEREATGDELKAAAAAAAANAGDPGVALAVLYIGAAVHHRLPRHPIAMTEAAGASGPHVRHVVRRMLRSGKQAFWPSQAAAIQGGLLDRGHPSMAIKMPTSAGKTALIELVTADALDADEESVAVVLAPTKALVRQLSSDLHRALPEEVTVRSSHGGLDFDIEGPSAEGILSAAGVIVVTPERFDLEWRQHLSSADMTAITRIGVLVVDEAHLMTDTGRGPRLELIMGRAIRAGIRLVLLSSQLPEVDDLARWMGGSPVESAWTPTWLQRFAYYHSADNKLGLLRCEGGDPVDALMLSGSSRLKLGECPRERAQEAAALAVQHHAEGLVVIYTDQRTRADALAAAAKEHFTGLPLRDAAQLKLLADPLAQSDPGHAQLLRLGIGVHHANVPRRVRAAVEAASRRDQLRCLICSPTLLEGIDFPVKTVIAAYPPQNKQGKPQIGKLRNLAGRAGRGGRFPSASLIVMSENERQADKWLNAFTMELPATRSALTTALKAMFTWSQEILSGQELIDDENLAVADATLLAAIAEGAVIDGDLRHAIEESLGRTLWYAGANAIEREQLLRRALRRADYVAHQVRMDIWARAFYRSGLPLDSCIALRNALIPCASSLRDELLDPDSDRDDLLIRLATQIAPVAKELGHWNEIPPASLHWILYFWLTAEPEADIDRYSAYEWKRIRPALETLIPWVLTAVIDFIAVLVDEPDLRELAHRRLAPARLRYGVPDADMCELVRDGFDREDAVTVVAEFSNEPLEVIAAGLASYARRWRHLRDSSAVESPSQEGQ